LVNSLHIRSYDKKKIRGTPDSETPGQAWFLRAWGGKKATGRRRATEKNSKGAGGRSVSSGRGRGLHLGPGSKKWCPYPNGSREKLTDVLTQGTHTGNWRESAVKKKAVKLVPQTDSTLGKKTTP